VTTRQLSHDRNLSLARHLRNAVVRETGGGVLIVKDRRDSPRKIDLAVAAVVAHDRAQSRPERKRGCGQLISWSTY
jgi:phage terminase large subunit-like protein